MHFLDGECEVLCFGFGTQAGSLPDEAVDAVAENDHVRQNRPAFAIRLHADHAAVGVLDETGHGRFAEQRAAGLADPPAEPLVELRAEYGVAIGPLFVEVLGTVMHPHVRGIVKHPEALLDNVPLQRSVFAEVRNDLLERVRVEDRSLDILRARIFAPFQLQDLHTGLGHRVRRRISCGAGAYDDRVEVVGCHVRVSLSAGQAVYGEPAAKRLSQRRQELGRVGDDPNMGKVKNGRVRVCVDRHNQVRPLNTNTVLNRPRDSRSDVKPRPNRLAGLPDLPVSRDPALLRDWAGASVFAAQDPGELHDKRIVCRGLQSETPRDDNVGIGELCLVRNPIWHEFEDLGGDRLFGHVERVLDDPASPSGLSLRHPHDPWPYGCHLRTKVEGEDRAQERTAKCRPGGSKRTVVVDRECRAVRGEPRE